MAIFDLQEQRMCVRIVYDGVAGAGKTSNLRQLCASFSSQRATEMVSPAELDGRTLFFDWVQFAAGVVCGYPLICQVISVPGQVVLTPRRRHLLASADVVVYVCDSASGAIGRAREGLELLREVVKSRAEAPPVLIQANKQDQIDALDGPTVQRMLGYEDDAVLEAIALDGMGVVDTFVSAVRTVVRAIQTRSERESLRVPVRPVERPEEVLKRLQSEIVDPEWAAELLLEEASTAFALAEAVARADEDPVVAEMRAARAEAARAAEPAEAPPSLPKADVAAGFIWPAHTGRATLRALADEGALDAEVQVGGEGEVVHRVAGRELRTSRWLRFTDVEAARQALIRAARERTQIETLLVPETVVVLHAASDGAQWLWTIAPHLTTILAEMTTATIDRARDLLGAYATAVVDAIRIGLRHGIRLGTGPRCFGLHQGAIRYIGGFSGKAEDGSAVTSLDAIIDAATALEEARVDVGAFLDAAELALARRLGNEELSRLVASTATTTRSPNAEAIAARLRLAIARRSEAA